MKSYILIIGVLVITPSIAEPRRSEVVQYGGDIQAREGVGYDDNQKFNAEANQSGLKYDDEGYVIMDSTEVDEYEKQIDQNNAARYRYEKQLKKKEQRNRQRYYQYLRDNGLMKKYIQQQMANQRRTEQLINNNRLNNRLNDIENRQQDLEFNQQWKNITGSSPFE